MDTCFKYVEEQTRRKPQHCRFGFVHFVQLWVNKKLSTSEKDRQVCVKRTIARVGKEPVLPRDPGEPRLCSSAGPVKATPDLFQPGSLGASVECDDRQARRGRVNAVRFNPREGSTLMAGLPAHRGNLDFQDCRRTLTAGFEESSGDWLRSKMDEVQAVATSAGIPAILKKSQFPDRPARMLFSAWAAALGLQEQIEPVDTSCLCSTVLLDDLENNSRSALCCSARRFYYDVIPRRGARDRRRVGDRVEPPLARHVQS